MMNTGRDDAVPQGKVLDMIAAFQIIRIQITDGLPENMDLLIGGPPERGAVIQFVLIIAINQNSQVM